MYQTIWETHLQVRVTNSTVAVAIYTWVYFRRKEGENHYVSNKWPFYCKSIWLYKYLDAPLYPEEEKERKEKKKINKQTQTKKQKQKTQLKNVRRGSRKGRIIFRMDCNMKYWPGYFEKKLLIKIKGLEKRVLIGPESEFSYSRAWPGADKKFAPFMQILSGHMTSHLLSFSLFTVWRKVTHRSPDLLDRLSVYFASTEIPQSWPTKIIAFRSLTRNIARPSRKKMNLIYCHHVNAKKAVRMTKKAL